MFRRVFAGLVLGPALFVGSLAWSGYLALSTVFDENRSQSVAEELLENDEVRRQLAANIGQAISAAVPAAAPLNREQADSAALAVLDDQRATDLFVQSLGSTHRAFLGQGQAPETLDLNPLAELAREQLAAVSPDAAAALPESLELTVGLPTRWIPNATPVKSLLETAVPLLAGLSLVMFFVAFLTTTDRPSVLRRAAKWAIMTAAFYLVVGWGLPALLPFVAPTQAAVLGALITALLRTALTPSVVLGVVGAALLVASWIWTEGEPEAAPADYRLSPQPQFDAPPTTHVPPARPQVNAPPQQAVTPPSTPVVPAPGPRQRSAGPTPSVRPPLPTRAAPADSATRSAWTGNRRSRPPHWVEGYGWVLDLDDDQTVPPNARYVEGVGYVVPGSPGPDRRSG